MIILKHYMLIWQWWTTIECTNEQWNIEHALIPCEVVYHFIYLCIACSLNNKNTFNSTPSDAESNFEDPSQWIHRSIRLNWHDSFSFLSQRFNWIASHVTNAKILFCLSYLFFSLFWVARYVITRAIKNSNWNANALCWIDATWVHLSFLLLLWIIQF